jgi:type I restriction enzyme R subunit
MPTPGEHKTVQARILAYAEAIGWTVVSREDAERRRGFDPDVPPADRAKNRSLFFDDLLDAKVREFNPRYAEAEGALLGQFRHLHTDIYGNPPTPKRYGGTGRGNFFDHEEKRERDLILNMRN